VSTKTQVLHTSPGGEKLIFVQFVTTAAFAYNGTNYYTIELRVLRSEATYPVTLGSILSLATRSLVANVPIALYENDVGLRLNAGDALIGVMANVGAPALLANPSFLVEVQSQVR
jgi:hypothetical protein